MDPKELIDEQKRMLKDCRDSTELKAMLNGMGIELTDEQLDAVAAGEKWYQCDCYSPGTYGE